MRARDLKVGELYRGNRSWRGAYGALLRCIEAPVAAIRGGRPDSGRFMIVERGTGFQRAGETITLAGRYIAGPAAEVEAREQARRETQAKMEREYAAARQRNRAALTALIREIDRLGVSQIVPDDLRAWARGEAYDGYDTRDFVLGTEAIEQLAALLARIPTGG